MAIQKIIKMAAANGVAKLLIGQNGYLSTPASSSVTLTTSPLCILSCTLSPFTVRILLIWLLYSTFQLLSVFVVV